MNLNGRLSYEGNVSGSLGPELVADVEANPSGPASQTLVKIRVGDVIYSIPTGGGGGGTSDYNLLNNKPKINNHTIEGELTLSDLGIQEAITFPGDAGKYLDGNGEFSTPEIGAVKYIDVNNIIQAQQPLAAGVDVNYTANEDVYIYYVVYSNYGGYRIKINNVEVISNFSQNLNARADIIFLRNGSTITMRNQDSEHEGFYIVYGVI